MRHYRYIGTAKRLQNATAWGMVVDGVFMVQVDELGHPWSYSWWGTPREDWQEIENER